MPAPCGIRRNRRRRARSRARGATARAHARGRGRRVAGRVHGGAAWAALAWVAVAAGASAGAALDLDDAVDVPGGVGPDRGGRGPGREARDHVAVAALARIGSRVSAARRRGVTGRPASRLGAVDRRPLGRPVGGGPGLVGELGHTTVAVGARAGEDLGLNVPCWASGPHARSSVPSWREGTAGFRCRSPAPDGTRCTPRRRARSKDLRRKWRAPTPAAVVATSPSVSWGAAGATLLASPWHVVQVSALGTSLTVPLMWRLGSAQIAVGWGPG